MTLQYTAKNRGKDIFHVKNCNICVILAENIDCGYIAIGQTAYQLLESSKATA